MQVASEPALEWWRTAVIYQVYPRSFADSDGDGVGDLRGIRGRLEQLLHLGVDALWLSPFYPSPMVDGGYDVADHTAVDPVYGTLADFDALLTRAHDLGLRVIIDVVPNHTSDEHQWFRAALSAGPGSPERECYLFRRGRGSGGAEPPNNWQSVFGGPAWSRVDTRTARDDDRGLWYLHLFDARQPDLNWAEPEVQEAFEGVLRFWLDRGVDGFRIDVAHGLAKQPGLPDWAGDAAIGMGSRPPLPLIEDVDLGPMFDQEAVHDIYRSWRRLLAAYPGDRVLVAEAPVAPARRAARYVRKDELHQAFNFFYLQAPWRASTLREVISESLRANAAVGAPTTWVMSNHDTVRHASRLGLRDTGIPPAGIGVGDPQPDCDLGLRRARAAALLTLALPGSVYLYQGEELGLPEHTMLDDAVRQDPTWVRSGGIERGRDGCRVPLPWEADAPAFGFSPTGRSWLPQPPDWAAYASSSQTGVPGSTLELYGAALHLRRLLKLGGGDLTWLDGVTPGSDVLCFRNGQVVVCVNFGSSDLLLPCEARVLLASDHVKRGSIGRLTLAPDTSAWLLLGAAVRGGAEMTASS